MSPCRFSGKVCKTPQARASLGYFVSPLRYISVSLLTAMYHAENLSARKLTYRTSGAYVRLIAIRTRSRMLIRSARPHAPIERLTLKSPSRASLESFAQYFGNYASRARSFMKINSRRTPLVSCVLHQNLLRDRQHLREPAHCDVSAENLQTLRV